MFTCGAAEMRALEHRAMDSGISERVLMEHAGAGAAKIVERVFFGRHTAFFSARAKKTAVLIGPGNNGGDGIVAARDLAAQGIAVTVFSAKSKEELVRTTGGSFLPELPSSAVFRQTAELTAAELAGFPVIVDAIFGTGFHGEVRPPYDGWITAVNRSGAAVAALDLPSGVNADTGECAGHAVLADATLTFGAPKHGLFQNGGDLRSGRIFIVPIGIAEPEETQESISVISDAEARQFLPRIPHDSHKNSRGSVLLICGSRQYPGAAGLAAAGCAAGGAGLLRMFLEAMPQGGIPNSVLFKEETFDRNVLVRNPEYRDKSDVIVAGCGWGREPRRTALLETVLRSGKKTVLDADALNVLSAAPFLWDGKGDFLLTPHPGEAQRLCRAFDVPCGTDRIAAAKALAARLGAVVLLKGNHSVIAAPDGRVAANPSGCAALAKAGSGDVLAGLCGAFFARSGAFDAARFAAYFHGRGGELAECARSLTADGLTQYLAPAMAECSWFA